MKLFFVGAMIAAWTFQASAEPAMTNCIQTIDFTSSEEHGRWNVQNDNVMGGRSTGGPSFDKGHLTFSGFTNTDGGGFSSIRSSYAKSAFAEADAVRLTLKSDGRAYQLSFRTTKRDGWGRRYAFRAPIPQTAAGEWETVIVPLSDLPASIWGQRKNVSFDPAKVTEYGFFIYDGVTGPFSLEVKTMEICSGLVLK